MERQTPQVFEFGPYHLDVGERLLRREQQEDQALFWLEKSARERMGIILIKVQPYFDSLRSDPRLLAIERRMALSS